MVVSQGLVFPIIFSFIPICSSLVQALDGNTLIHVSGVDVRENVTLDQTISSHEKCSLFLESYTQCTCRIKMVFYLILTGGQRSLNSRNRKLMHAWKKITLTSCPS